MAPANVKTCTIREALRLFVEEHGAGRSDRARRDLEGVVSLIETSLDGDELTGRFFIHCGDDSEFTARRSGDSHSTTDRRRRSRPV